MAHVVAVLATVGNLVDHVQPPTESSILSFRLAFFRRYSRLTHPYALFPVSAQAEVGGE